MSSTENTCRNDIIITIYVYTYGSIYGYQLIFKSDFVYSFHVFNCELHKSEHNDTFFVSLKLCTYIRYFKTIISLEKARIFIRRR